MSTRNAPVAAGFGGDGAWLQSAVPPELYVVGVFLAAAVVTILTAFVLARLAYGLVKVAGPRTKRVYGFLTPNSPIGKAIFALLAVLALLFASIWAIPILFSDSGDVDPVNAIGPDQAPERGPMDKVGTEQGQIDHTIGATRVPSGVASGQVAEAVEQFG